MESKWTEIFEEYLNNKLSEQERIAFEEELRSDKELENSFLIFKAIEEDLGSSIRNKSKENELRRTFDSFSKQYAEAPIIAPNKKPKGIVRIIGLVSAIAASLLLIFFVYNNYFESEKDIQQIAQEYFDSDLHRIGQTMGSNQDSLKLGLSFYTQKEYVSAVQIFENLIATDSSNSEIMKNLGLAYLGLNEFDKALEQFQRLSQMENLHANPGLFYQGLTLLLRNEKGDRDQAKLLLEEVIDQNQEGSKKAKEWVEKM